MTNTQNGPNKKDQEQPKTREEKMSEILRVLDTEDIPENLLDEILKVIEEQKKQ